MMDLSNFKLLKEDSGSYHVQHPGGKTMMIDKKGMTDRAHELIKKMAQGGSIMGEQLSHSPNPKLSQVHIKDRFPNNVHKYAEGGDIKGDDTPVTASKLESQYAPEEEAAVAKAEPQPSSQAPIINNHYYMSPTPPPAQGAPAAPPQQAAAPAQEQPQQQTQVPVAQDQAPQQPDQSQPQDQQAQVPASAGPQGSVPQFSGAEKAQEQDIAQAGQVQSQEQQRNAETYDKMQKAHQEIANQMEQTGADYHQNFENIANQVASGSIDPNRWWNQKSTGSKVATAIGMLLGGAGAGVSGHPDMPMKIISAAIDRDIDSQKTDLNNKNNLLGQYSNQYRSSMVGEQALSLQYGAVIEGMLKRSAALSGSQSSKLAADNAIQQLRQGLAPKLEDVTKASVMTKMFGDMGKGGSGPSGSEEDFNNKMHQMQIIAPDRFKDMETKYVPGVGVSKIPIPDKSREELSARTNLSDQLATLETFSRKNTGTTWDRATVNKGQALARNVQDAYRRANAQGVFRKDEKDFVEKSIATDPTSFLARYRTIPGYIITRSSNNAAIDNLHKTFGITPFAKSQSQVAQGSGQDAQAIAWAKNPANAGPKADAILRMNGNK